MMTDLLDFRVETLVRLVRNLLVCLVKMNMILTYEEGLDHVVH